MEASGLKFDDDQRTTTYTNYNAASALASLALAFMKAINNYEFANAVCSPKLQQGLHIVPPSNQYQLNEGDLSLWIDRQQVKLFSGFQMEIYVIADGNVLNFIRDPLFSSFLPVIPSEVSYVNFTWKSGGNKKYFYHFDRLISMNEDILHAPIVSVSTKGRVPRKPRVFSVLLPCLGNVSGIASFSIGLLIESKKGKPLPGTPLRLRLRKECAERVDYYINDDETRLGDNTHLVLSSHASASASAWSPTLPHLVPQTIYGEKERIASSTTASETSLFSGSRQGPDPECSKKCSNGGWCNSEKMCLCMDGYMGRSCETALCYPQCMNDGVCTKPGICSCKVGFNGRYCEGGICKEKCLNGGKCIQKDTCECPKGFYGLRCEFTQCLIPCLNGGRCRGVNKCRCPKGFVGNQCEIGHPGITQHHFCKRPCHHGVCSGHHHRHNTSEEKPIVRRRKVWV
nr:EOG090X05QS [Eubosmina coregoni]